MFSLPGPADDRPLKTPATGESAGRGFRRGTAITGTGLADVWERNDAKDWIAMDVNPDGFERGGEGAPSDAWILCIIALYFPAIGMALHKCEGSGGC